MKRLLFFIIAISILSSCVSRKPDAIYVSESDYNLRKSVHGAHFRKRVNIIGVLTMVGGTAAGAYLGYNTDLYDRQIGTRTEINQPANAVVGGLIGLSVTTLGNYIAGRNQTVSCKTPEKWLKKSNGGYVFLEGDNSQFRAIHKSAESKFVVRNYQDVNDFMKAYPNSMRKDQIILAASGGALARHELKELIQRFPDSKSIATLKKEYVQTSTDLSSLFESSRQFGDAGLDIELLASNLVYSIQDMIIFLQKYPASRFTGQLIEKISPTATYQELDNFIIKYPNAPNIKTAKTWCVIKAPTIEMVKYKHTEYRDVVTLTDAEQIAWKLVGNDFEQARRFAQVFNRSGYVKKYQNDRIYVGQIVNNQRHGYGFMIEENGAYNFRGNWYYDKKSGYGEEYRNHNEYYYKGNFSNGEYSGQGEQKRGDVDFYKGEFKDGERWGQGTLTYETDSGGKATYNGKFVNGYMNGAGRIDLPHEEWIEGTFEDGQPHGVCTFRSQEGYRFTGRYDHGIKVGKHTYRKFILGGLVDLENGEIDFGNGEGEPVIREQYNIFSNDDSDDEVETAKPCVDKWDEVEDYKDYTFKFSGRDYKVYAPGMLYRFKCADYGPSGYFVLLSHDTEANTFWDYDWESGWYYYDYSFIFPDDKNGPFKTLEAAKTEICDCD